jgi:hypothetical protein
MTTAVLKHFTQTDPLQSTVGQAYPSTYVYGNNNPNMYVDPLGLRGSKQGASNVIEDFSPDYLALLAASPGENKLPGADGKAQGKFCINSAFDEGTAGWCDLAKTLATEASRVQGLVKFRRDGGSNPGRNNAFRHSYWFGLILINFHYRPCAMCSAPGLRDELDLIENWSRELGRSHEAATLKNTPESRRDTLVDLHNNDVGIALGRQQREIRGKRRADRERDLRQRLEQEAQRDNPRNAPGPLQLDLRSGEG